jgi:hypothetical protein
LEKNREDLLNQKTQELQVWAEAIQLLQPGERLEIRVVTARRGKKRALVDPLKVIAAEDWAKVFSLRLPDVYSVIFQELRANRNQETRAGELTETYHRIQSANAFLKKNKCLYTLRVTQRKRHCPWTDMPFKLFHVISW